MLPARGLTYVWPAVWYLVPSDWAVPMKLTAEGKESGYHGL